MNWIWTCPKSQVEESAHCPWVNRFHILSVWTVIRQASLQLSNFDMPIALKKRNCYILWSWAYYQGQLIHITSFSENDKGNALAGGQCFLIFQILVLTVNTWFMFLFQNLTEKLFCAECVETKQVASIMEYMPVKDARWATIQYFFGYKPRVFSSSKTIQKI